MTLTSLHLRHSSFSNPSAVLPTSQVILQPFRCFTYVIGISPTSPGEPTMPLWWCWIYPWWFCNLEWLRPAGLYERCKLALELIMLKTPALEQWIWIKERIVFLHWHYEHELKKTCGIFRISEWQHFFKIWSTGAHFYERVLCFIFLYVAANVFRLKYRLKYLL